MTNSVDTKKCSKCGEEKPFGDFSPHAHGKHGLQARCKACCSAANSARYHARGDTAREEARLRAEKFRREHPEEDRARKQEWREANRAKDNASKRAWDKANPEKKAAANRAWVIANQESKNANGKAWKKANPEATRRFHLKRYGLTFESYGALLESQGGACAICRKTEKLHIDHDHDTGKTRGLLCLACNTGLGQFKESAAYLRGAIVYLERHAAPLTEPSCPAAETSPMAVSPTSKSAPTCG